MHINYKNSHMLYYVLLFFFLTTNTLLSIPIDKLLLFLLAVIALFKASHNRAISIRYLVVSICYLSIILAATIINGVFEPMSLYPIVGILFIGMYRNKAYLEKAIYYALLIHILLALLLYVYSYFGETPFVRTMRDKGLPFIHASLGFTSTNQVFGTLCVLWLLCYFDMKEKLLIGKCHKLWYGLCFLAILSTLNRSTFLFLLLILAFKDKKLLFLIFAVFTIIAIIFYEPISTFLLSANTLTSRGELLEGFKVSYLESHNILIYLFGKGTIFISEQIALGTTWNFRLDIENGYAFLLHGYGILGLLLYIGVCFNMLLALIRRGLFFESAVIFFYAFLSIYFTQEFVSNSFYLIILYLMYVYHRKRALSKELIA